MMLDARKLRQAVRKKQVATPSEDTPGSKRVRVAAKPFEAPAREVIPIIVRMTSDEDDIPLVDLLPIISPIGQPFELSSVAPHHPTVPPPTEATSSWASRQDRGKAPRTHFRSEEGHRVEEEPKPYIDLNIFSDE